jgi:TctA family transporter
MPGAAPTIATFMSYALEKKASRHPQECGHGARVTVSDALQGATIGA